jgi:hypothetical protein
LYFEPFSPQKCRLNFQQSVEAVWKQICNAEALQPVDFIGDLYTSQVVNLFMSSFKK